jgi:hypothetical protein
MSAILPKVRSSVKQRLLKNLRHCRNAGLKTNPTEHLHLA